MYRTHRCSVHVASYVSIYGYGTHLIVGNHFRSVEGQLEQMMRILSEENVMCGAAEVEGVIKDDLKLSLIHI